MKRFLSGICALLLVCMIGLTGCSSSTSILSGNYQQDTLAVVNSLRTAINLPDDSAEKVEAQATARQTINEFASYYRRDKSLSTLTSFTMMRTALNSLASHYNSYGSRPLPDQLKTRLEKEFQQVESAIKRGA
ncbi:MAG: photosystem II protein Psb27 [Microcoleaceae cyanobacterium]